MKNLQKEALLQATGWMGGLSSISMLSMQRFTASVLPSTWYTTKSSLTLQLKNRCFLEEDLPYISEDMMTKAYEEIYSVGNKLIVTCVKMGTSLMTY